MAYFFQKIDTRLTQEQRENTKKASPIYNLDEFHTIKQSARKVIASRDGEKPVCIANCRASEGAKYVMDKIRERLEITVDDVIAVEDGASSV